MLALLLPLGPTLERWHGCLADPLLYFISCTKIPLFYGIRPKKHIFFARFVFLSYLCTRKQANVGGIAQLVRAHDS